jgi:hypothetical protein
LFKNGLNKRNFRQCVADEFLNSFGQNFKISQNGKFYRNIARKYIPMQYNTCHNQNIKLIITILQSILLDYMSLQELKQNSNSNLNCKLIKQKIKKIVIAVIIAN